MNGHVDFKQAKALHALGVQGCVAVGGGRTPPRRNSGGLVGFRTAGNGYEWFITPAGRAVIGAWEGTQC